LLDEDTAATGTVSPGDRFAAAGTDPPELQRAAYITPAREMWHRRIARKK
jgi:hypothetical protein